MRDCKFPVWHLCVCAFIKIFSLRRRRWRRWRWWYTFDFLAHKRKRKNTLWVSHRHIDSTLHSSLSRPSSQRSESDNNYWVPALHFSSSSFFFCLCCCCWWSIGAVYSDWLLCCAVVHRRESEMKRWSLAAAVSPSSSSSSLQLPRRWVVEKP